MAEHLLNIREAAEFLGIGERKIKELVDLGKIPAYKIGGTFLRFKKSQLAIARTTLLHKDKRVEKTRYETAQTAAPYDNLKDFLYFNDFYILSVIVIVTAVILMIAT